MPALPQSVQPEVPALVIEQPGEESSLPKEVDSPSICNQPAEVVQAPVKTEPSINNQKPPMNKLIEFEFARRSFSFISPTHSSTGLYTSGTYQDLLNEKKQVVNKFLGYWVLLFNPDKDKKQFVEALGNRLKPYLKIFLMMNGGVVSKSMFKVFRDQLIEIGNCNIQINNPPKEHPLLMFYDALVNYFKKFIQAKESSRDQSFTFQLTDSTKAEIETILQLIESFTVNTPEGWKLP